MRITRKFLAILAAPLLSATMITLSGPAMAASSAKPPGDGLFVQLESGSAPGPCITEVGTTSTLTLAKCSATNDDDLWYEPTNDTAEWANLGTGLCFSVTGKDPGVYLNTCDPGQPAQEFNGYGPYEIQNLHTHYCLWQSNANIQQRNSCTASNVHDEWYEL